jgi:hypothetical protein
MDKVEQSLAEVPIEDYFNERMKDPEFAKAYAEVCEELEPAFEELRRDLVLRRYNNDTE